VLIPLLYVWLRVTVISDSFVRSELGNKRFKLCSLWARYTGDSKSDLWDDPGSILVCAVQIWWRLGPETASFHASVHDTLLVNFRIDFNYAS